MIGGWAADAWTWRTAFYVLALPGIVAAVFIWLVLREPASALGVQNALIAAVCVFWLAALSYYMASRTLRRDLYVAPSAS